MSASTLSQTMAYRVYEAARNAAQAQIKEEKALEQSSVQPLLAVIDGAIFGAMQPWLNPDRDVMNRDPQPENRDPEPVHGNPEKKPTKKLATAHCIKCGKSFPSFNRLDRFCPLCELNFRSR